jgi:hypothetical protein
MKPRSQLGTDVRNKLNYIFGIITEDITAAAVEGSLGEGVKTPIGKS